VNELKNELWSCQTRERLPVADYYFHPLILKMQLLLCASTESEISYAIEFIRKENIHNVDILVTGVGLMSTTYSLTKAISKKRPDFVLQAGIAGCLDQSLPLTKTVLVENENIGDLGVQENGIFKSLFDLKLLDPDEFPWKNGKLSNNVDKLKFTGLKIVDGVTVNEISTNTDRIAYYRTKLNASVESMEGAALHYVCLQQNVRCLQMRSLSNFVGERDKSKWVMDIAVANLNAELLKILIKLINP
jgi:futalosine hydrolase